MPQLQPFRAIRYSASAVPDLSAVLCPPYDVISPAERIALAERDPHNAVYLELPDSYESAADAFARWTNDGTLRRDERPQIYIYEQRFRGADGSDRSARGFFCRLRLEPYGPSSGVRPHEATMSGPKEDRFRLMSAVAANLSPVLLLYEDSARGETAEALMASVVAGAPTAEAVGPGGLVNRLWVLDAAESDVAKQLLAMAGAGPLTIADGHHRYETALRYRDEVGGGSSDFVLALMYEAQSGGLDLLPWHRLVRGVNAGSLLEAAAEWFRVTSYGNAGDVREALSQQLGAGSGVMGLWTREGGALLEVDRARVSEIVPSGASETLRWLDVSVLSSTLSRMIGVPSAQLSAEGRLTYTSDAASAVAEVDSGSADAAFLLRPTPIADVLAVAAAGEHMPAKSTFFYPKAATGLVFNSLVD